jgi:hypothetical protein
MRVLLTILVLISHASAEIVDRIVATVGNIVITESELVEHLKIAAFLNQEEVRQTPEERKKALERLVEQALIRHEIEISRYNAPDAEAIEKFLQNVKARFKSEEAYLEALAKSQINDEQLRQAITWQITLLRFIQYRFRPGIQVSEEHIQSYYDKQFLPEWSKSKKEPPPPLPDVRDRIARILTAQREDEALDQWLEQAKKQTRIRIHEEALP